MRRRLRRTARRLRKLSLLVWRTVLRHAVWLRRGAAATVRSIRIRRRPSGSRRRLIAGHGILPCSVSRGSLMPRLPCTLPHMHAAARLAHQYDADMASDMTIATLRNCSRHRQCPTCHPSMHERAMACAASAAYREPYDVESHERELGSAAIAGSEYLGIVRRANSGAESGPHGDIRPQCPRLRHPYKHRIGHETAHRLD